MALIAAATTVVVLTAGSANAVTGQGLCGSDYNVLGTFPIYRNNDKDATKLGRVVILKNQGSQVYCAVTIKETSAVLWTTVKIRETGGTTSSSDAGNYSSYAGPVYKTRARPGDSSDFMVIDATIAGWGPYFTPMGSPYSPPQIWCNTQSGCGIAH